MTGNEEAFSYWCRGERDDIFRGSIFLSFSIPFYTLSNCRRNMGGRLVVVVFSLAGSRVVIFLQQRERMRQFIFGTGMVTRFPTAKSGSKARAQSWHLNGMLLGSYLLSSNKYSIFFDIQAFMSINLEPFTFPTLLVHKRKMVSLRFGI